MALNPLIRLAKFVAGRLDEAIGAGGVIKGITRGVTSGDDLGDVVRQQIQLEKLEDYIQEHTGEEMELNTPVQAADSIVEAVTDWSPMEAVGEAAEGVFNFIQDIFD